MNREFLKNLGLEDDVVDKIMAEYGKSVQSYKDQISQAESLKEEKESLETQLTELQQTIDSQKDELSNIEELKKEAEANKLKVLKMSIADQAKIPLELAERLNGETEEEIKADAEKLAGLIGKQKTTLPLKPTEPEKVDEKEQAYAKLLDNLD